ncbi:MAG: hypothetical protein PUK40_06995 [Actinomycetaceae bacterium]|nr:hypothetical protein [Arcanobacterium sp.]MDD7505666.1 hypothetical protein [Actinomycetaceae bacterium]MDY6143451.1 hypothetical protein [Arcanobacterium sp.]
MARKTRIGASLLASAAGIACIFPGANAVAAVGSEPDQRADSMPTLNTDTPAVCKSGGATPDEVNIAQSTAFRADSEAKHDQEYLNQLQVALTEAQSSVPKAQQKLEDAAAAEAAAAQEMKETFDALPSLDAAKAAAEKRESDALAAARAAREARDAANAAIPEKEAALKDAIAAREAVEAIVNNDTAVQEVQAEYAERVVYISLLL